MKENVKVFLIALIIGMVVAFFLSYKFQDQAVFAINPKVTYFYVGTYNSLDVANTKAQNYTSSFVFENNGIYQVVIGVYQDKNVIDLMSSYFLDKGITFYQEELKVDNKFLSDISNYELLIKSSDSSYYESINSSLLNLFREYMSQNNE